MNKSQHTIDKVIERIYTDYSLSTREAIRLPPWNHWSALLPRIARQLVCVLRYRQSYQPLVTNNIPHIKLQIWQVEIRGARKSYLPLRSTPLGAPKSGDLNYRCHSEFFSSHLGHSSSMLREGTNDKSRRKIVGRGASRYNASHYWL